MNTIYYNHLAEDYHLKRKKPWKALEQFLKFLIKENYQFKGYSVDLGCANGRNFKLMINDNVRLIGIDNSIRFLKIAKKQLRDLESYSKSERNSIQLILSDILFLPIRPDTIDNIYSIATIHHVKIKEERMNLIYQIFNILKSDGLFLFSVWRKYQKHYKIYFIKDWIKRVFNKSYRKKQREIGLFNFGDKYVPWKISKNKKTYLRFYHFFSKFEIKNLLAAFSIKKLKKLGGPNKKDNFFVLAKKS
jgi:SAM-dependent methyltransferase